MYTSGAQPVWPTYDVTGGMDYGINYGMNYGLEYGMYDDQPDYREMQQGHHETETLLKTVKDCGIMCDETYNHVLSQTNLQGRQNQIRLLTDCASICSLTACMIARQSPLTRETLVLCAKACEACGHECGRHRDRRSQTCSQACLNCAKLCRQHAR